MEAISEYDIPWLAKRGMPDLAVSTLGRLAAPDDWIEAVEMLFHRNVLQPDQMAQALAAGEGRLAALPPDKVEWMATRLIRFWTRLGDQNRAWALLDRIATTPAQRAAKAVEIAEILAEQGKEADVLVLARRWSAYLPPPDQPDRMSTLPGFDRALLNLADHRNRHGRIGHIDDLIALASTPGTKALLWLDAAQTLAFVRRPAEARRLASLIRRDEDKMDELAALEKHIATIERLLAKLPNR